MIAVHPNAAACALAATLVAAAVGSPTAAVTQTRVNQDAQVITRFTKLAQDYVALHKKVNASLSEVSRKASPEQVDEHERALGKAIEQTRAGAKPGEIFTSEIRAYFRRQLSRALAGAQGAPIRASVMEENPGAITLRVNGRYPDTIPVTTMPPQILAVMPKLPPELEFRFIGRRLVLIDLPANTIVDFFDDALPR